MAKLFRTFIYEFLKCLSRYWSGLHDTEWFGVHLLQRDHRHRSVLSVRLIHCGAALGFLWP